jgi:2-oxoglutarate ferredoxin oxidoreductase subunit alpha
MIQADTVVPERIFCNGNHAVGWGALSAGCEAYYGYPITPQNEILEWFAREFPARGKVFVQSHSETGSINMLLGGAATGVRSITTTSSPGWSLMQETMSHMCNINVPAVIVNVCRAGPGMGTSSHSQGDYRSVVKGGGHGDYNTIVLSPASVQEVHDLTQLAFHLAEKYLHPVVVLSDAILGQGMEPMEIKTLDFGPTEPLEWALVGKGHRQSGKRVHICTTRGNASDFQFPTYLALLSYLDEKYKKMAESEVRFEAKQTEDADLVLVGFGSLARIAEEAMIMARAEGLRVGLVRPITLWPFPSETIGELSKRGVPLMVVEDNLGQMFEDVRCAAAERVPVHLVGMLSRHQPGIQGMIFPDKVLEEIKKVI